MGAVLRVDPERLRKAAAAESDVGAFVAGMTPGEPMAQAGSGMPGLLTEGACHFAAASFDTAARAVHDELTEHSTRLSAAAEHYHQADEELGRRIHTIANGH